MGNSLFLRSEIKDHISKCNGKCKFYFVVGCWVVLLDQVTKLFFSRQLNYGGAFSLGEGWSWILLMLLAIGVLSYMLIRSKSIWERVGLVFILFSGLSNLIDRVVIGGVRDFIYWPILNVYGNVADVVLTIGVGVVVVDSIRKK